MTASEQREIDDATKARHNQWRIIRRLNWIIALLALIFLKTFLHPK